MWKNQHHLYQLPQLDQQYAQTILQNFQPASKLILNMN